MKGNPFLGAKFLWQGISYVEKLFTDEWWKNPPVTAEIDPSNLCNHKCIWCMFREFRLRQPDIIRIEDMKRVICELAEMGCKAVTFTGGGEPLCNNKVFPRSLHEVVDHGMQVGLVTNGSLVGKYVEDILRTCTYIRFSLDSATAETHRKTHQVDGFDVIINNVKEIASSSNIDVGLAFLVHPINYQELKEFCQLGYNLGVDYVQIRPAWMPGLSLSNKIINSVMQSIEEMEHLNSGDFQIHVRMDRFEEIRNRDKGFIECLGTPLIAVIGADLNVYLCCQHRGSLKYSFGNLKESSFEDVWFGDRRRQIAENIDVNWCPPCRYRTYNKILHDLKYSAHKNFL